MGMVRITVFMTIVSAFMSLGVARVISLIIPVGDLDIHLRLAFAIPFFVTPMFSWLTAMSMRDSKRARKTAFDLARLDPLTGVFNRRAFFEREARSRTETDTASASKTVLFLDIDHFKAINDTFGHEGGDAVLVHLAGILKVAVRDGDIVARFGGEEFVIVAHACEGPGAVALADRIIAMVHEGRACLGSRHIPYTVSIGVASGARSVAIERLLADADANLYVAKQTGRDRVSHGPRSERPVAPAPLRGAGMAVAQA
jgi:diguanylate cyclase (GGDEF)-like protein